MHIYRVISGRTKKAVTVGGLASVLAILLLPAMASGAVEVPQKSGLAVSPPTFELSANPGDVLKNSLRVDNVVDQPLEVTVDVRNFTAMGEDGGIDLTAEGDDYSLASWVGVQPGKVIIPGHQSQTFDYTITVPANAAPGGHFASIIFQTAAKGVEGQSGVAVSQEVGTLVFVKVAGQVTEAASIASFDPSSGFNDYGPVGFDIRVKNDGNVQFKPTGSITISNFFGQKVATIPIHEQNVLPGAIRKMNANWDGGWLFGRYTATLSLVYGKDKQVLTASTAFWGFPYKLVGIILLVLAILFAIIFPRRKRLLRALKILLGKD